MTPDAARAKALAAFERAGAEVVDLPVLQRAETLLDLYGEDIRGRAYTARDPLAGELMLRPDFTVPVVEMHLDRGVDAGRYAYAGKVFRMQEAGSDRPSEYDQVGFEVFGGAEEAEAEVFSVFAEVLHGLDLRIATGDIGILRAAVEGLSTSPERKAALLRHLWRPKRFRKLLAWFTGDAPRARTARTSSAPFLGLRSQEEVNARLELLDADAKMPPIPAEETAKIAAILSLKAPMAEAADRLGDTLGDVPSLQRMRARISAMEALGIDVTALEFEGAYGRTNMEYYDGFVFGFYAAEAPLPPVATGGRYDALTAAMGRAVPAVGGVIRPALFVEVAS